MGINSSDDDLGPGLHVLRQAEPLKRAGGLAARLRGELCATLPQADAALAERSRLPLVDVPTLSTLEVLARRLARAERIAARTRAQAVVDVGHRLAGAGSGLAIHPTTIRDRAAALTAARADLAAAEEALSAHAASLVEAAELAAAEREQAAAALAESAAHREALAHHARRLLRTRRSRALGAIVAALGLGLILLGLQLAPLWAALLPALGACLWAMRYLRPEEEHEEDDDEHAREAASRLLADVAASTEAAFIARWGAPEPQGQDALLVARRDAAQEEVRVAERAWHELAGEDTDVDDLEEVVRRLDPQHEDARLLASETVGVRAADVVLHHFQQRWLAFWRTLGLDAPAAEAGEAAVRDLAARVSRPIVLVGPAAERGSDLARVAPAAPVIVLQGPTGDTDSELI